jgi:hypothetical protein
LIGLAGGFQHVGLVWNGNEQNGKMAKWQNGKMAKWQNGKMAKWQILLIIHAFGLFLFVIWSKNLYG